MTWLSQHCLIRGNHLHQTTTFFHCFSHRSSPPTLLLCQAYPGPPMASHSPPNRPPFSTDYTCSRTSDHHSQLARSNLDPYPAVSGSSSYAQRVSSMAMLEELRACEIDPDGGSETPSTTCLQLSTSTDNMGIDIPTASTANVTIRQGLDLWTALLFSLMVFFTVLHFAQWKSLLLSALTPIVSSFTQLTKVVTNIFLFRIFLTLMRSQFPLWSSSFHFLDTSMCFSVLFFCTFHTLSLWPFSPFRILSDWLVPSLQPLLFLPPHSLCPAFFYWEFKGLIHRHQLWFTLTGFTAFGPWNVCAWNNTNDSLVPDPHLLFLRTAFAFQLPLIS